MDAKGCCLWSFAPPIVAGWRVLPNKQHVYVLFMVQSCCQRGRRAGHSDHRDGHAVRPAAVSGQRRDCRRCAAISQPSLQPYKIKHIYVLVCDMMGMLLQRKQAAHVVRNRRPAWLAAGASRRLPPSATTYGGVDGGSAPAPADASQACGPRCYAGEPPRPCVAKDGCKGALWLLTTNGSI